MNVPPVIFDRALQQRWRDRASARFAQHDALKTLSALRLLDRLDDINRHFALALDIGAHRGEVAASLAQHKKIGRIVSADASAPMIRQASGLAVCANEEALPFAEGRFDLALSAFALHRVNDLPGTLVQLRRCLKPDGLLLANFPGGNTLHELRSAFAEAETSLYGGLHPRISPFVEVRDAGGLLQRAGFALPVVDSETVIVTYRDVFQLMHELRYMGEGNSLVQRSRRPMRRELLTRMAEIYHATHAEANGRIRATLELVTLTAWAPHGNQQQPLKPGSATHLLADALGAQAQQQQ